MTRRMIDSSMWQNEKFHELPLCARLLQISLINAADDQGRTKATPKYLKVQVFPFDEVSLDEIQQWLEIIQANGTIILYTAEGKQYAQLANWWKYQALQYAQPSQHPRPPGWQDRIRRTATKGLIVTYNWQTVDGVQLTDTCDQDGIPLPKQHAKASESPKEPTASQSPASNYLPAHSPESPGEHTRSTKDKDQEETTTLLRAREVEPETQKTDGGSGGGPSVIVSNSRNRQNDLEYAAICKKFESEGFGTLTPMLAEEINALMDEYPQSSILDAMSVAVQANKRQLRYVRGILVKWRADGRRSAATPAQKPKPLLTLKRWCFEKYNIDNPRFVRDVPEDMVHAEYELYRQQYFNQQAH